MKTSRLLEPFKALVACERGNMLVEFALAGTVLVTTVLGLFDYAAVTNQSIEISNAARAAVDYAVHAPTDTAGITDAAVKSGDLTSGTLTVAVNQFCECPGVGSVTCATTCADGSVSNSYVKVTLSQPAESFLGVGGLMVGKTLQSSATLRTR